MSKSTDRVTIGFPYVNPVNLKAFARRFHRRRSPTPAPTASRRSRPRSGRGTARYAATGSPDGQAGPAVGRRWSAPRRTPGWALGWRGLGPRDALSRYL